jgi:hypothetical protein
VAFVRAGVNRDSLRAEPFAIQGYFYQVGVIAAACIPDGGNFVYIYAQFGHVSIIRLLDIRSFDFFNIDLTLFESKNRISNSPTIETKNTVFYLYLSWLSP